MGLIAFLLFVALPILEIALAILVAGQIGWAWTLLLLLALSALGVLVIRGTIRAAGEIARSATPPTAAGASASAARVGRATADAGFRLLAGVLLVIPGFLTGCAGLFLLLPPVRALARAAAGNAMLRRYPAMQATFTRVRFMTSDGDVIRGEVIEPDAPNGKRPDGEPPNGGRRGELT
ncbi:MAG TPA: FxsA family protein [Actinomycetes bacterium]|nr:FxsA family protein [Actinomycetes bacterium]